MKLLDIVNGPWAIVPDNLAEIQGIYATHLRGEKIDIAAIEARLGRPLANEQQQYSIRAGGVAVLPIEGVLAPKMNLFMEISGGSSTQMLTQQVESAIADPRVKALVLSVDSPGGSVLGTPELAAAVRELSALKPIVAVTDGTMASAAYWLASATNAIYASGPTVMVGSIGVVASHTYTPQQGRQTTEITAGAYKRINSGHQPLSAEGAAYMQGQVDHLYEVFVDTVAANRGTTPEIVLEHMADGRVFIGRQALEAGLIDGFATVDMLVEQLAADPSAFATRRKATPSHPKPAGAQAQGNLPEPVLLDNSNPELKGSTMDRATLEQQHPALFAQLQTEFAALGATAERTRIQAVESALIPGHEALIASLKFDGKTTGGDAALAVNQAERTIRTAQGAAANAEAPKPVASTPPATVEQGLAAQAAAEQQRISALPLEARCQAQWEASAALRAEFSSLGDYTALVKAQESGKVRVLGKKAA